VFGLDSYELSNKLSGSIESVEFFKWVGDCVPWS